MSHTLAPSPQPSTTVNSQLQTVHQCAQPCCCTGQHHHLCAPRPPDKVLPSHPHPTLEGLSTPTMPPKLLARATSLLGMPSLVSPLMASSAPSILPLLFSSKIWLSLGGGTAHPFCVGGLTLLPWKRTRCKHHPCCVCRCHGFWAPNQQEHPFSWAATLAPRSQPIYF
jgi:hypothetical protein